MSDLHAIAKSTDHKATSMRVSHIIDNDALQTIRHAFLSGSACAHLGEANNLSPTCVVYTSHLWSVQNSSKLVIGLLKVKCQVFMDHYIAQKCLQCRTVDCAELSIVYVNCRLLNKAHRHTIIHVPVVVCFLHPRQRWLTFVTWPAAHHCLHTYESLSVFCNGSCPTSSQTTSSQ